MTRTSLNHQTSAPPFVPTPVAPMRRLHEWSDVIAFFGGQHAIAVRSLSALARAA